MEGLLCVCVCVCVCVCARVCAPECEFGLGMCPEFGCDFYPLASVPRG
jgi:hypothetical protein